MAKEMAGHREGEFVMGTGPGTMDPDAPAFQAGGHWFSPEAGMIFVPAFVPHYCGNTAFSWGFLQMFAAV